MEKATALVTRIVEFSETSCVVTLYSREFGKISGLAKGARRLKSPFEAAIDLLALCRIVFIHKSSDALDLLTEAKLQRRFRAGSRDLSRLYTGYYIAELLNEMSEEGDPHPELFDAADRALASLDASGEVPRETLRFEMTALSVLGHVPSLDACTGCGTAIARGRRVAFGPLAGGVLCGPCKSGRRQIVSVGATALDVLRCFGEREDSAWRSIELSRAVYGEIRGVLNHYFNHLLGHRLRTQRFLSA